MQQLPSAVRTAQTTWAVPLKGREPPVPSRLSSISSPWARGPYQEADARLGDVEDRRSDGRGGEAVRAPVALGRRGRGLPRPGLLHLSPCHARARRADLAGQQALSRVGLTS